MKKQLAIGDFRQITVFSLRLIILLLVSNCLLSAASAQDDDKPKDLVPPPLAIVSKDEKERLEAETDVKKHTETAIQLMDARLLKATELSSKNQYKESLDELGGFQAILRNAFNFLKRNDNGSKKVLNNFKKFEINLRAFVPRLEIIRREMPIRYGYHVRTLMKYVRDARADAVEPLFDDSILSKDS
jgi:hypothetical protein